MKNPFNTAQFVVVDFNPLTEGFELIVKGPEGDFTFPVGTADAAASIIHANNVRHYDLTDRLISHPPSFTAFLEAEDAHSLEPKM
jgi:hypothetical protein